MTAETKQEDRVLSTFRKCVVIAGAAALLSTQAAYAAPPARTAAVDPLVALSLLGTAQSRAAVCGDAAACSVPIAMQASAATASPLASSVAATAAAQGGPKNRESSGLLALLAVGGLMVLAAVLVAVLAGNEEDNEPVSPA